MRDALSMVRNLSLVKQPDAGSPARRDALS